MQGSQNSDLRRIIVQSAVKDGKTGDKTITISVIPSRIRPCAALAS
jgi:hypothetical protein